MNKADKLICLPIGINPFRTRSKSAPKPLHTLQQIQLVIKIGFYLVPERAIFCISSLGTTKRTKWVQDFQVLAPASRDVRSVKEERFRRWINSFQASFHKQLGSLWQGSLLWAWQTKEKLHLYEQHYTQYKARCCATSQQSRLCSVDIHHLAGMGRGGVSSLAGGSRAPQRW